MINPCKDCIKVFFQTISSPLLVFTLGSVSSIPPSEDDELQSFCLVLDVSPPVLALGAALVLLPTLCLLLGVPGSALVFLLPPLSLFSRSSH